MKNTSSKLPLITSLLLLVVLFALSAGTVYAWFSSSRFVTDTTFTTGELNTSIELYYWKKDSEDTNKWTATPATGMTSSFYPNFGSMDNIVELPQDCNVFIKMRVWDPACPNYDYHISLELISVNVYSYTGGTYVLMTNDDIDYYSESIPQACIDSYFVSNATDNMTPTELSTLLPTTGDTLNTLGQSFSAGDYVSGNQWMYIKLTIRQPELMNIIRRIPTENMPYSIEFVFDLISDTRTTDDE